LLASTTAAHVWTNPTGRKEVNEALKTITAVVLASTSRKASPSLE
jgi:hypothetical protein